MILALLVGCSQGSWRTASRQPAGIAPDPASTPEPVVQVYGAPAWGWRGWFAIHTWIATKARNAPRYTVYEVVGWRQRAGLPVLRIEQDHPDRYWFGERPQLLLERRGAAAGELVEAIDVAARSYPWAHEYRVWPGPNSNTFPAWIGQQVPELGLELPLKAIGQGWVD
ncbi:DUF3750 domain-containing protein [Motiliproteus sp. SC1-56]|uniref:DUF3750 domain-containing protein n=1 Tax=Motiliproteus sp. SC1-56 TaxID=2799565 RepID=UPI00351CABA0